MIGVRIQNVFDYMSQDEINQALSELYCALEETVGKVCGTRLANEGACRQFLRNRMEVILGTWLGPAVAPGMKLSGQNMEGDDSPLEDILFDGLRTAALGQKPNVVWMNAQNMMMFYGGKLYSSLSMIWGITLAVMTCPVNKDERIRDDCLISTSCYVVLANDLWGQEEKILAMLKKARQG